MCVADPARLELNATLAHAGMFFGSRICRIQRHQLVIRKPRVRLGEHDTTSLPAAVASGTRSPVLCASAVFTTKTGASNDRSKILSSSIQATSSRHINLCCHVYSSCVVYGCRERFSCGFSFRGGETANSKGQRQVPRQAERNSSWLT